MRQQWHTYLFLFATPMVFAFNAWLAAEEPPAIQYTVLGADGAPVPESDLSWVRDIADTLAAEADDPWLQTRVAEEGVYQACYKLCELTLGGAEVFGIHGATPETYVLQTPKGLYHVDAKGTSVLRLSDDIHVALPFHEGLAAAGTFPPREDQPSSLPTFRYIDREGKTAIAGPFANAGPFVNGLAVVGVSSDDGRTRFGMIDRTGAWKIAPKFDGLFEFQDGLAAAQISKPDHSAKTAGFIDETGTFVVELDDVQRMQSSHHNGLALVWRTASPKYVFVDRAGKTILAPDYAQVEPFHDGYAAVSKGDAWAYIDTEGREVVAPKNFIPMPFHKGMVAVAALPAGYSPSPNQ